MASVLAQALDSSAKEVEAAQFPKEEVWLGIDRLLSDYADVQVDDSIVIAYSPDSRGPAAWVGLACEQRHLPVTFVPLRPLRDSGFRARLAAAAPLIPDRRGKVILLTFERDTMSHHGDIRAHFASFAADSYRVIRAINAGSDLFATGLALSPEELSALNATLLARLRTSSRLQIRTDAGTDLRVSLKNQKFHYVSNRGFAQPRQFVIIPAGEVATFPDEISGTLVADFALNVNTRYDGDVRLRECPVTVQIRDGRLQSFSCENAGMSSFLDDCLKRDNARRVGELGFGTNKAVRTAVSENSHLNERVPGIHLGFGQHNQTNDAAGYACDIHIDLCAKGGRIWFDDSADPLDLEQVKPASHAHPDVARDEDVFSEEIQVEDCCGLLPRS
ncbi:aminopeptidase [Sphingomonas sp.]|uniref:aminopeptidase n=1 Tax=Sphingomonas sp. TaxID=28214 RepID=UPI0025E625F0|nr:aminopeptidase [Sphingomonas sp.]